MKFILDIKQQPDPNLLPLDKKGQIGLNPDFKPSKKIKGADKIVAKLEAFKENFDESLLNKVYSDLFPDFTLNITVTITQGFKEPNDIWFLEDTFHVVINATEFLKQESTSYLESALTNEFSHFLFHKHYDAPYWKERLMTDNKELIRAIDYHIFVEGISHFITQFDKIDGMIEHHSQDEKECTEAIEELKKGLEEDIYDLDEKDIRFFAAFSGSFWEQYGDITGLFKCIRLYKKDGLDGIINAIKVKELK